MASEPVTEIVTISLKAGVNLNDSSSAEFKVWQQALSTVARQEGYVRAYYGIQMEDPAKLDWVIDWTSLEAHQKFIASPQYGPFLSNINAIFAAPPSIIHFHPKSTSILSTAPVVEMATFFGLSDQSAFIENVRKFMNAVDEQATKSGALGSAFGAIVEDIEKEEGGGKGRAVKLAIGWQSKEAHMKFRETDAFKNNIQLLRDGTTGAAMHHTAFKSY